MQKIACLFSFKESNWVSCQKIVFNLHKSYEFCPDFQLENFNYPHEIDTTEQLELTAKKILQYDPDVITIMDHRPHPLHLFSILAPLYTGRRKPKLIFHLFGDFTIYYSSWEILGQLIKGFPVEFLVASDRQKILIDRMFNSNSTIVCPFPVDHQEFFFDQKLRTVQRAAWNLKEDDVAFLFTGRLSRQKRIKTLISTFAEALGEKENAHLFFYGNPDSIGDPFLGIGEIEGEYFRKFYRDFKELPENIRSRIHFMGAVPNSELLSVYAGADVLTNLSVHNDEDYGMSVAEAQFTGLPCILTDWGGLASFAHASIPEATSYIPVKITRSSKKLDRSTVIRALKDYYLNPRHSYRLKISTVSKEKFGLNRVTQIIQSSVNSQPQEFGGYSKLFDRAALASAVGASQNMYLDRHFYLNKLYHNIYSAYVRSH